MKSGVIVVLANEETGSEKVRVLVKLIQFVSGRARTHQGQFSFPWHQIKEGQEGLLEVNCNRVPGPVFGWVGGWGQ